MREQILYYAYTYDGEWKKMKDALDGQKPWKMIKHEGNYVTIEDDTYPNCFRTLEYAPWILFYEGDLSLCDQACCGIIGSRLPDAKGIIDCNHITNILKRKYVIISGLAKGIDAIAHTAALDYHTIAVIGCGLHVTYPKENAHLYEQIRKGHLLISEYPPDSKPYAYHFPWRNRLIAALSDHLVVIEAKRQSGTMLTVNEAITLNKDIYCVPHAFQDLNGEGCNLLISQGANILVDDKDIDMI